MRWNPLFFSAALFPLLGGCLDNGTTGAVDPDAAYRGTLRVELTRLNPEGVGAILVDLAVGAEASDDGWVRERVQWSPDDEAAALVAPCDVRANPYRAEAHAVGVYATAPAAIGEFGTPLPDGAITSQDARTLGMVATCVAGAETVVRIDLSMMTRADPGFIDTGVVLRSEVGDAIWDLRVLSADTPPKTYWEQRISSSTYGDSAGDASYVGPCDSGDDFASNGQEIRLVGVFADDVDRAGDFGEAVSGGEALEVWPVPVIAREVTCYENRDVFALYEVTVAHVERDGEAVRARIGDATCEAGWACDALSAGPALQLSCAAADVAPSLHLDDLVVRCDGVEVARVDPAAVGDVAVEQLAEGRAETRWWVVPALDATQLTGACVLETGATVDLPAPRVRVARDPGAPEGASQLVYPRVTWSIPVSDADGPVCADAALDLDGPVTVTYTSADAFDGVHYDHVVDPQESR